MALVGNLKDLKLTNIIQINCIERNVSRVSVKSADRTGYIYFSRGEIVHAEFGPFIGERAVHEMLALTEGDFKVEAGIHAPTQSIYKPWNSIVLEGLRLIDERKILTTPLPKQLFGLLSDLNNVKNIFVLDYDGTVLEGRTNEAHHPLYLTFVWYKVKKLLNLFYSDLFQYIVLRKPEGFCFIFEYRPNLIVLETDARVVPHEFTLNVKKILKQLDQRLT